MLWDFVVVILKFVIVTAGALLIVFSGLMIFYKIMDLFVREVSDPEIGSVRIGLSRCDGKIAMEGKRRIPFALPAKKREVVDEAKSLLLRAKANWPSINAQLMEHFASEIEVEGIPPDLIKRGKWVQKLARDRDYENLQRFTKLEQVDVEYGDKNGPIQLRISTLHRWDPEHERVLLLDEKLAFKFYGLGCEC
jgi:hypothetical protein